MIKCCYMPNQDIICRRQNYKLVTFFYSFIFQPVQRRSCGWNDRHANHVNSIWSRDYKLGPNADNVPHKMQLLEKPTTKGMEKIISVKGLKLPDKELLAKRPRSGMFLLK